MRQCGVGRRVSERRHRPARCCIGFRSDEGIGGNPGGPVPAQTSFLQLCENDTGKTVRCIEEVVWKLKQMVETSGYGEATANRSILGSLTLSLDFVNLFPMLLRLPGRRK